jgi:hypothetical protein
MVSQCIYGSAFEFLLYMSKFQTTILLLNFAKNKQKFFVGTNIFLDQIYFAVFGQFSSIVYCIKHFENELPINSKHVTVTLLLK